MVLSLVVTPLVYFLLTRHREAAPEETGIGRGRIDLCLLPSQSLLTAAQARVLGALVEKEVTTPDYYPLSLNALINACNQRSNREPVMNLDEDDVRQALHGLEDKRLAGRARSADGRVTKYEHWLGEAFNFSRAETALLCVLLLRGPQTPGELRGRTERLHTFEEIADVLAGMQKLMDREPPLAGSIAAPAGYEGSPVRAFAFRAGREYSDCFCRDGFRSALRAPVIPRIQERFESLEAAVDELRQQVAALSQKIDNLFG